MNKEQVLQALKSNQSTRTGTRISATKVYNVHTDGDITARLAPQAQALLAIMYGEDAESWTEVELHAIMMQHTEISVKQSPWLVFKFYRQTLIDAGFLSIA